MKYTSSLFALAFCAASNQLLASDTKGSFVPGMQPYVSFAYGASNYHSTPVERALTLVEDITVDSSSADNFVFSLGARNNRIGFELGLMNRTKLGGFTQKDEYNIDISTLAGCDFMPDTGTPPGCPVLSGIYDTLTSGLETLVHPDSPGLNSSIESTFPDFSYGYGLSAAWSASLSPFIASKIGSSIGPLFIYAKPAAIFGATTKMTISAVSNGFDVSNSSYPGNLLSVSDFYGTGDIDNPLVELYIDNVLLLDASRFDDPTYLSILIPCTAEYREDNSEFPTHLADVCPSSSAHIATARELASTSQALKLIQATVETLEELADGVDVDAVIGQSVDREGKSTYAEMLLSLGMEYDLTNKVSLGVEYMVYGYSSAVFATLQYKF